MSGEFIPVIIVPVFFISVVLIVKSLSDNSVRRKAIDKGLPDESVKALFERHHVDHMPNSLKWGMVSVALGLAVLVGQMVPNFRQEEATISAMLVLGGLALILFYVISSRQKNVKE